jgi:hypothetical protein
MCARNFWKDVANRSTDTLFFFVMSEGSARRERVGRVRSLALPPTRA